MILNHFAYASVKYKSGMHLSTNLAATKQGTISISFGDEPLKGNPTQF